MSRTFSFSRVLVLPLTLAAVACGDPADNEEGGEEGADTTDSDPSATGMTDPSATDPSDTDNPTDPSDTDDPTDPDTTDTDPTDPTVPAGCADPADENANRVEVSEAIDGGAAWTCDTIYVLTDIIFVNGGALTIEPGTTIQGTNGSALVISQDATIEANGEADAPIVFTSALPEGSRNRGDWGGLVLLGSATINVEGGTSTAEGFANPPAYGGTDDTHNCGSLQYVRVEWAGFEISAGSELNAITFYACGTDTTVDYVQTHMGADDGIEMFGGTFDAKHIIVTGAADDSIDTDEGYRGRLQHVFIHQDPAVGDNCFEWATQGTDFTATPATGPQIVNATCVGSGAGGDKSKGVTLKEGTEAFFYSSIFTNITNEAVELTHLATQQACEAGNCAFEGVLFGDHGGFNVATDDEVPPEDQASWTPAEFETFILDQMGNMDGVTVDGLDATWGSPNAAPAAGSVADGAGATPSDAFFDATTYAGAVDPAGDDWTQAGWINYSF